MPQSLSNFVTRNDYPRGSSQGVKNLQRRQQIAEDIKIKPPSNLNAAAQSQSETFRQPISPGFQDTRGYLPDEGGIFDGSELSFSDDTTRDLSLRSFRGYPPPKYSQEQQETGNQVLSDATADTMESEHLQPYEDEREMNGYSRTIEGKVPAIYEFEAAQERIRQTAQSREFLEVSKKVNGASVQNNSGQLHQSISGRFTGSANLKTGSRPNNLGKVRTRAAHHRSIDKHYEEPLSDEQSDCDQERPMVSSGLVNDIRDDGQFEHHIRDHARKVGYSQNLEGDGERLEETEPESPSERTPQPAKHQNPTSDFITPTKRGLAALELDYDENVLSRMKYTELRDQLFDSHPNARPSVFSEGVVDPKVPLESQLRHFADEENSQLDFFAQMPLDQWEESGDWFIDRFAEIMSRLKDARAAKRKISKSFEEELAAREEGIRGQSDHINKVLRQMREGGEGVLKRTN